MWRGFHQFLLRTAQRERSEFLTPSAIDACPLHTNCGGRSSPSLFSLVHRANECIMPSDITHVKWVIATPLAMLIAITLTVVIVSALLESSNR